jgi:hypothetical protein
MKLSLSELGRSFRFQPPVIEIGMGILAFASLSILPCQGATTGGWNHDSSAWTSDSDGPQSPGPSTNSTVRRNSRKALSSAEDPTPYSPGSNNVSLEVGQVFLMGDLGDKYADSIGTQLHYTYGVSNLFGFDASAGYSSHSDGQYSMATALMGLRTNLSYYDHIIPYSIFGMGFYKPSFSYQTTSGQDNLSPVLFGLHLGAGVDLVLTRNVFFGASITLHDVFGGENRQTSSGPISVGGTFTSFLLHAGMSF